MLLNFFKELKILFSKHKVGNLEDFIKGSGSHKKESLPKPSGRKRHDCTRLTVYHYDFIIRAHSDWQDFNRRNPKQRKPIAELVKYLNDEMGTNKSHRSLALIWGGHVKREDMSQGDPNLAFKFS
jgi:hypothetical protein